MKSNLLRLAFCLVALFSFAAHAQAQSEAEQHFRRSFERLTTRDVDGALAELDKAVALKSDYAEAYEHRSRLRMLKGNVAGALADLDKAVEHAPDNSRLYIQRGRLRMMRNDAKGALADFDSAIARGHRSDEVYASRGHLKLMSGGDAASAIDDFTTAISLNPSRVGHYLGRSGARSMAGDEAGALVDLNYIIEQHERREKERRAAGLPRTTAMDDDPLKSPVINGPERAAPPKQGDDKEAGKKTERIQSQTVVTVSTGPSSPASVEEFEYTRNVAGAYLNRGQAHSRRGDSEAAIKDFDKALEIYPRDSHTYYSRAQTRRERGQLEAALADFTRAVELEPQFPFNRLERAVTLLLLNRDADADKEFAEIIKLAPTMDKTVESRRAETLKKREAKQD